MRSSTNKTNTSLHTVILQTSQMEKMASFYAKGLELEKPVSTGGNHLGFTLPNVYFGFDLVSDAPKPTAVLSLWFEVDDLEETFHRFQEMGTEIKYPPTPKPWGAVLAALYDPDGNLFGLTQREQPPE